MLLTYRCPKCEATARANVDAQAEEIACHRCGHTIRIDPSVLDDGGVHRCLVCPSKELFVRKNFPQRLGVAIVVIGFAISCVTWYFRLVVATFAVLFATAAIDVLLYWLMGNVLECYRCGAQYSGAADTDEHGHFDLEIHERYRQEKIRLAEAQAEKHPAT